MFRNTFHSVQICRKKRQNLEVSAAVELPGDGLLQDDTVGGVHGQGDGQRKSLCRVLDVSTQGLLFPSSHTGANGHCIDTGGENKRKRKKKYLIEKI